MHHLAVEVLVETHKRCTRQGVDPVACRGRQTRLLARHEVLRHLALATVDLDMAVNGQRHPVFTTVVKPHARQGPLPLCRGMRQGPSHLLPHGLDLGTTVKTQQKTPLPGRLIAQPLRRPHPGHGHEGHHEKDGRDAVEPRLVPIRSPGNRGHDTVRVHGLTFRPTRWPCRHHASRQRNP